MTAEACTLWLRLYDARMADWKTNEEQLAKVAAIIEAALSERAAIVAWLRSQGGHHDDIYAEVADDIEDGAHHKDYQVQQGEDQ